MLDERISTVAPNMPPFVRRWFREPALWLTMRIGILVLLPATVLLSGCGSTLHLESTRGLQRFHASTGPVYVTNPEIGLEYEMLKASAIYQLSDAPQGCPRLTLHPIVQYARCANPLMLTGFTFGLVPGILPAARAFQYDLETDGKPEQFIHRLPLYERFSIWEWLLPRRSEQKLLADALSWSSRQPQPHLP